ncbi:hypothetical protein JCM6882_001651 [Rhodosporidiobolus microsporus]
MTSLALQTTFPSSHPHSHSHSLDDAPLSAGGFSVLPSPSTFGLSSQYSSYHNDYSHPSSAFDYSLPSSYNETLDAPSPSDSVPSLLSSHVDSPRSSSSEHGGASSPATSFRSTPAGSPHLMDKALTVVLPGDGDFASLSFPAQHPDKLFSDLPADFAQHSSFEGSASPISLAHHAAHHGQGNDVAAAASSMYAAQPQQHFGEYSSHSSSSTGAAPAAASLGAMSAAGLIAQQQHQPVYAQPPPHHQQQQPAYYDALPPSTTAGSSLAGAPVYMSPPEQPQVVYAQQPQQQQQQQASYQPHASAVQQATPLQLVSLNGVTYAMPVAAPAPAAIETPHGTYYFVPTAPTVQQAPVQLAPSAAVSEPFVLSSGLPAPVAASIPGLSPLSSGPSPMLSPSSASGASLLPGGIQPISAVPPLKPTPLDPQQKIRLPVGQGKRGSTKRQPKKDQVKRFVCPFDGCGRGFARNFNMQSHYASHLGVRNFNCPHCPKKFSRRHDRARHCAAVHDSHVDRDGNILGASGSASQSPSSSAGDHGDHDHEGEHDELDEYSAHSAAFNPFDLGVGASTTSTYSVEQHPFAIGGSA